MATTTKLVREVEVKCDCKLIYDVYKHVPNDSAVIAKDKEVHKCELVAGQWGTPGSIIVWHYTHDGKKETMKEIIEVVDDELHKIVFKVIEGDMLEVYNTFIITLTVEDRSDKKFVIWTIEFEKKNASIPEPTLFMDLLCAVVEDMDAHFLKKP